MTVAIIAVVHYKKSYLNPHEIAHVSLDFALKVTSIMNSNTRKSYSLQSRQIPQFWHQLSIIWTKKLTTKEQFTLEWVVLIKMLHAYMVDDY